MENSSRFADIKNDKNVMDKISALERELSEKTGKPIILVAYSGS